MTYPVTLGLRGLAGVRVVRSSSDVGFSTISVIFDDDVAPAEARRRVAERLAGPPGGAAAGACRPSVPTRRRRARSSGTRSKAAAWTSADCGRSRTGTSGRSSARCRASPRSRASAGSRSSTRSRPTPNGMRLFGVTLKGIAEAIAASNAAAAGHVVQKGNAEFVVRGVNWLGASTTPGRRVVRCPPGGRRSGERAARRARRRDGPALGGRPGRDRARLPPRRAGEGRQRGHRRRGPDGERREPARADPPHQGEDPRAAGRPARRACGSSPATTGRR